MRDALGDGYAEALWKAWPDMPQSADFVMFWWDKAARAARGWKPATEKTRAKGTRRFGLITTNSLRQTFNRKVLEPHLADPKTGLSLTFAIPDHPWVDAGEGAAVRIAMTVAERGRGTGRLLTVTEEIKGSTEAEGRVVQFDIQKGKIFANLRIGADVAGAVQLKANERLSSRGVMLFGAGFIVSPEQAHALGLGNVPGLENHIRNYRNGRDLTANSRGALVIDLFGLTEAEVRNRFPAVYQHILDTVKPERNENRDLSIKKNWWIFGRPRSEIRPALHGLTRFIVTVETTKHRNFQFLDGGTLPDNMLVAIGLDDAGALAVLSSRFHVTWALTAGGRLGFGNDPRYNKSKCFDPFPFPDPTETQKARLRSLGEQLDAHRKAQQAAHPKLTLTAMYNVLEKLRAGEHIEGRDREIYDQGLVGILRDLHDQIDAAVAQAYGWPVTLSDDDILHRLVDLNRERAAEEARGLIRWLRPDYQNPAGSKAVAKGEQTALDIGPRDTTTKAPWPKSLPEQIAAVQSALHDLGEATPEQIARQFLRARAGTVRPLLESLTALGHARQTDAGRFVA